MIQHLNEVKAIARTANHIGAPLPEKIAHALTHLEDISRNAPEAPRPAIVARDLAEHIGDPVAMDKALKRAASDLAAADATAKIHAHLAEACGTRLRGMMRGHTEQIATAFGDALAADLDALTATAGRLPAWFNPAQADTLDPETFAAWSLSRDAYDRIKSAQAALAPLYAGAIDLDHSAQFPLTAAASLWFAEPPTFQTAREAYAFRDALAGRTERTQGLAGQGSTFVDGLFIPTALAHVGASFVWATPAEVTERAEQIVGAILSRDSARV